MPDIQEPIISQEENKSHQYGQPILLILLAIALILIVIFVRLRFFNSVSQPTSPSVPTLEPVLTPTPVVKVEDELQLAADNYSRLVAAAPLETENFKLVYSFANLNFEVLILHHNPDAFYTWLNENYPGIDSNKFVLTMAAEAE